jgi:tight adherence protein B
MKMRRLSSLLVPAILATGLLPLAASAGSFHITEAGAGGFPNRAYVLSLPTGMRLSTAHVHVTEGGNAVDGLTVTPVEQAARKDFGAVLVIDASTSMRGRPEAAAFAAAHAFAAQRKPQQQLAVVAYNLAPSVILPFTTDSQKINQSLVAEPPLAYGTHIYDAVVHALDLLRSAHIKAGSIVLLSDGQEARGHHETGTHETEASASAAARAAHVRVFTVGLPSRLSKLGALQRLARDTGGRFSEASSIGQLSQIYDQLGSLLASEYLVRYRSLVGPGKRVDVRVRVDRLDGVATTSYESPALRLAKVVKAPHHRSSVQRVWSSAGTMLLIVLIAAGLVGLGAMALLSGPRKGTIRGRMAEFVSVPPAGPDRARPTAQLTEKMLEGTDSLFKGNTWWERFRWELNVAQISLPPEQIAVLTVLGTIVVLVFVKFVSGSLLLSLAVAVFVPFVVRAFLKRELARRRRNFAEQLPDNLQVLSSALRAGHSFVGALSVVVNDAPEPAKSEFGRVVADEQLGVPIENALRVVVERMENRELEQVALVAALQRSTGGNTAEVLDRVTETIRERFELRRTVQTLTAQGRMSRWVLTLLPLVLLLVISLVNPGYVSVMYDSTAGRILLVLAGICVTGGSFVIKRIVDIKV